MYTNLEDYCTIGRPKGQINSGDADFNSPSISKIGGVAQFHHRETAPSSGDIVCKVCNSSEKIVLVAQIYAPLDFHRSLYVFGCNNNRCSYKSESWTVVRNQSITLFEDTSSVPVSISNAQPANQISWDTMNNFSDSDVTKKSSVKDDESDSDDDLADLVAMLAQRDNIIKKEDKSNEAIAVVSTVAPSACSLTTAGQLSCWRIVETEEDWTLYDEKNEDENEEDNEDSEGALQRKQKGSKSAADTHIEELLRSYLSTEDDAEVLSVFQTPGATNAGASSSSSSQKGKKKGTKGTAKACTSTTTEVEAHGDDTNDVDNNEEEQEEASEDRLARSGDKHRIEEYFLRRVSRYPSQVLRYAYGGQPLWITAPSPLSSAATVATAGSKKKGAVAEQMKSSVPCCELCGAQRVFECQLMPALLSYINTNDKGISGKASASASSTLNKSDLLASGLDFGVVAIFSCPNSCSADGTSGDSTSIRFATEIAVVQLPSDMVDVDF